MPEDPNEQGEDVDVSDETEGGESPVGTDEDEIPVTVESTDGDTGRFSDTRERIEEEADRAVEQFDERIVDMLSWVLDTETRARIFVFLRKRPHSTSEEVAEGTGLYPSTVREALAELHEEGRVERRKRESAGAGNNPYEYTAIAPSELVGSVIGQVQDELNTVFNLDRHLGGESEPETDEETEPVSISVEEEPEAQDESAGGDGADDADSDDADETDD